MKYTRKCNKLLKSKIGDTSKPKKNKESLRNLKTNVKKYQVGIRAHKRINLLDNDSSSDSDESLSRRGFSKILMVKNKVKTYKPQNKNSIDRRKFVTLTKIDLSDDNVITPRIKREFSIKMGDNYKKKMNASGSACSRQTSLNQKLTNRTNGTTDSSSKRSKKGRAKSNKFEGNFTD